jgi:TRAP-type C4-dicarboxylate transport system substrate-binding protein
MHVAYVAGPFQGAPALRARHMPRRSLLSAAVSGLAVPLLPRRARAAEIVWRIGHSAPAEFALHLRLVEAAGMIAARSNGRMQLQVYPNSELGSPMGQLAQLRAGTIQAMPVTCQILASNLAVTVLPMLGFAFAGYDKVWPAMDGALGAFLREQIRERLGLVTMERCWDFGFRQITTSGKVVRSAEDLDGLKLRTPSDADFIGLFQALKALPVAMPLNALENALRSHSIDGQEGVLPLVKAAGLYRVQSVCSLTNHVWDGQWLCINGKAWSNLPKMLQDVVTAAFDESALHQREDTVLADTQVQKDLEGAGMKFNPVDPESFRQALRKAGYYAGWRKKIGDDGWAALEQYAGRLA